MMVRSYGDDIGERQLDQIVECLKNGGLIIYPTDTLYAVGCDLNNHKAIEKLRLVQQLPEDSDKFSLICANLSHLSDYTTQIDNVVFKLMKRLLPGPYTFILKANNSVPKIFKSKKKTVGIRVPNHGIPRKIVEALGNPILASSVHSEDEVEEYLTDPELMHEYYGDAIAIVIDGGYGGLIPSTIIDCSDDLIEVIREGAGPIDFL